MKKIFAALFFLVGTFGFAQTSNVSATVTDSDGQTWNNGTYKLSFLPPSGYTSGVYTFNGAPWTPPTPVIGTLSSGGTFAYNGLQRNDYILPTGSGWTFSFCPNASFRCSPTSLVINSPTQNISSNLVLVAPRFAAGNLYLGSYGYLDVEVSPTPVTGSTYYNVIAGCQKVYNGASFACSGGGGTVNSVNASDGSLTISPNSGTVEARCTAASNSQIGCVQPDGTTTTIVGGKLVASGGSSYTLPIATTSTLGGIKPDGTTITVNDLTGVASAVSGGGGVQYPAAGMLHICNGDSRLTVGIQFGGTPPAGYSIMQDAGNLCMQLARTPAVMRGQQPVVFTITGCSNNGTVATCSGTGTLPVVNQVVEIEGLTSSNNTQLNSSVSTNYYNVSVVGSNSFSFPFTTTAFSLTADTGTVTEWGMVVNLSVDAGTAADANTNFAANVAPLATSASGKCIIYDDNGGNDILTWSPAPPATSVLEGYIQGIWSQIHAAGCKVARLTILPVTGDFNCLSVNGGCYAYERIINQWAETQGKDAVLAVNPTATAYVDYFIPYDRSFTNNTNQTYYKSDNTHPTPALNEMGASLINDALINGTHRLTADFDPTAPQFGLPQLAGGNTWTGDQYFGDSSGKTVYIETSNTDVLITQGSGTPPRKMIFVLGSNLNGPYGNALLTFNFNAYNSSTANSLCLGLDGSYLGALPSLCIDAAGNTTTSTINVATARKGTFICTAGGTIAVANTNYISTSDVIITMNTLGGTPTALPFYASVTSGTGFSVTCSAADTSTYNYDILN